VTAWTPATDALVSVAGVVTVATSSLAIARRLGLSGPVRLVMASTILGAGQIVLAVVGLSLLGIIGRLPLLVVHALVAAAFVRAPLRLGGVWASARTTWTLCDVPLRLMLAATTGAALVIVLHAFLAPVPHDDSLTYHLPRAAIYLQQRSLEAFSTPDLRQTVLPANAEILVLWHMAISGRNAGAPLVQAICWLGAILAVYRLARDVGARMRPALFAGLAYASLPGVVLQATTAQNDLTTTFFLLCTLLFARTGLAERRFGDLAIAGSALGLALGTKATAVLAVPALVGLVIGESVRAGRVLRREGAHLALLCATGVSVFGSYFYVQNLRRYGHPTGSAAFADLGALPTLDPHVAWSNLVRLGIRLSEPAGFVPPGTRPAAWLERAHARFAGAVRAELGVEAREPQDFMNGASSEHPGLPIDADITTFGPLIAVAGLPVLLLAALRRRADPAARALAWGALAYLLGLAALLRYNVHLGRFLVAMVAIAAPLLAVLYRDREGPRFRYVNLALVGICCATLGLCVAVHGLKPLVRQAKASRAAGGTVLSRPDRPEAEAAAQLLDRLPPGRVALVFSMGGLVHPLFDGSLTRAIRVVRANHLGTPAALRDADYVLVWGDTQQAIVEGDPGVGSFPWFELYDLRPMLGGLRSSLHPILDGVLYPPRGFHLFAKRALSPAELDALPDLLPSDPPLGQDRWRGSSFSLPVRLDRRRPFLQVNGEAVTAGESTISVRGPGGELLARFAPPVGRFQERVPLEAVIQSSTAPYAVLTFESSASFETEGRHRTWRSSDLALVSR
jgi:hypothetical protein